ncbi:HD domain-containing protein [Gephyromycinifex aptenodytis]|uniref:HD domain-containing protein n=1 Tax=Gephyromycinifex aptenodytis TaxID=2716227 RepID=UPI001446CEF0|nr:HD domain-containing phosphohydrolase [Gephyromycinifex aptenodytis]
MMLPRYQLRPVAVTMVVCVGVLLGLSALLLLPGYDTRSGWQLHGLVLLTFCLTITVGEIINAHERRILRTADIGATSALALALTIDLPSGPAVVSSLEVLGVTAVGLIVGGLAGTMIRAGRPTGLFRGILPRLVTVTMMSIILRDIDWNGQSLAGQLSGRPGWVQAVVLLALVGCVLFLEPPLRHLDSLRPPWRRWLATVMEDVRDTFALGSVAAITAVLVSVAQSALGLAALPVLLVPLAINHAAVRRHDEVRHSYRQTVAALSCIPETTGLVRRGHAERVARLSLQIGERLGVAGRAAAELERAALLHDLGQVHLRRPIPAGATLLAAPNDQEWIASQGASIVGQTQVLAREAEIIREQAVPYHHVVSRAHPLPLGSRIIKVANAFDDLVTSSAMGEHPPAGDRRGAASARTEREAAALERIYLGLGHEYDPRVVDALAAVVHDRAADTTLR